MVNNRVVHGGCGLGKENEMDEAYHNILEHGQFIASIIYTCMYVRVCVWHVSRLLEHILQTSHENLILELILCCPKKTH